jgi:hypothetical protein
MRITAEEWGPKVLPQCFRQLCIIKNLWQPGEPCKLFKTLNIYGLKGIALPTELRAHIPYSLPAIFPVFHDLPRLAGREEGATDCMPLREQNCYSRCLRYH